MSSYVSIKISPTEYKHFKVDERVKIYIMQLENALNNDKVKKTLQELYPRLNQNKDEKDPNAIYDWGSFPLEKNFNWNNRKDKPKQR